MALSRDPYDRENALCYDPPMANAEHLAKLQQGAEAWNTWRQENPAIKIDLQGAELQYSRSNVLDLSHFNLNEANLTHARLKYVSLMSAGLQRAKMSKIGLEFVDLFGANLTGASLINATGIRIDLSNALLCRAVLSGAALGAAKLVRADLTEAYMTEVNLSGADLTEANLTLADISDADLRNAKLRDANLKQAILIRADLSQASLNNADLSGTAFNHANLTRAYLTDANLTEADMRSANMRAVQLENANLNSVDLRSANLQFAVLDNCNADKVKLWETQRADWSIKGIRCESAYWDKDADEITRYAPGEFEQLYAEMARIEFFYQGGVSTFELSTLPAMLHHLASLHEGASIRLKSIEETGGGAKISISVSEADAETTEKIKADAVRVFQSQLALRDNQITRLQIEKEYLETFVSERIIHKMLAAAAPQTTFNAPVYNASFASGGSHVQIEQTIHDNAALLSLLETMLAARKSLPLAPEQSSQLEGELASAASELQKPAPNHSVLSESLGAVKQLAMEGLKKAAGKLGEQAVSADWHGWLTQLQELSHHLHL